MKWRRCDEPLWEALYLPLFSLSACAHCSDEKLIVSTRIMDSCSNLNRVLSDGFPSFKTSARRLQRPFGRCSRPPQTQCAGRQDHVTIVLCCQPPLHGVPSQCHAALRPCVAGLAGGGPVSPPGLTRIKVQSLSRVWGHGRAMGVLALLSWHSFYPTSHLLH